MIVIDGSTGEGGGQILRSALALSLVTGAPFRIEKIRAGRKNPGLLRQHLTAVQAAVAVGGATATNATLGATELGFTPGRVVPGDYTFSVGTAGSATLVLQTVLPALMSADGPSRLVLEGGTHNPFAPPFDFLERAFLPLLERMGPRVSVRLDRPGFYPAGGGRFEVTIEPARLVGLELLDRGATVARRARAVVAALPEAIARRELDVAVRLMGLRKDETELQTVADSRGPGNIFFIEIESERVTEVFTGFGERGVRAEHVAEQAVRAARKYLAANVPVGEYLADQLLLPLALAGNGAFRTVDSSRHTLTNIGIIREFLDVTIDVERGETGNLITVRA